MPYEATNVTLHEYTSFNRMKFEYKICNMSIFLPVVAVNMLGGFHHHGIFTQMGAVMSYDY